MTRFFRTIVIALLCLAVLGQWSLFGGMAMAGTMDGALEKAIAAGHLTSDQSAAIQDRLERIRSEGLPAAPFTAKIEEGLSKRVHGQVIVRALDAMRDDYVFAAKNLERDGFTPDPQDVVITGDSLRLGLTRQELSEMAQVNPHATPAMLATAARTRAYLNAINFQAAMASDIVHQGLVFATLEPEWTQLFRVVQRARAAGMADEIVAKAASRALAEGESLDALLQVLGFTGRDTRQKPDNN